MESSTVDIMLTPTPVFYLLKRGQGGNNCDIALCNCQLQWAMNVFALLEADNQQMSSDNSVLSLDPQTECIADGAGGPVQC